jgi:flagellar biosynthetic protein FlhB
MAENENSQQERTEPATPKRLEDARKKGQVARSRELSMMSVMVLGAAACLVLQPYFAERLKGILRGNLERRFETGLDSIDLPAALGAAGLEGLWMLMPLFGVVAVAAIAGTTAIGGFIFSFESAKPTLSKLNPLTGLKRVFGVNGLVELLKAIAKFLFVGLVATLLLLKLKERFLGLGRQPVLDALDEAGALIGGAFILLSATLVLIAAVDTPFQLWQHHRKLKMTKQEVKDEHKETEGRPEVKSRIRGLQQEVANRRMMEAVPTADVVTTNPQHFAVALKYDQGRMRAPRVVAKGADLIALHIRRLAKQHGVPLFEHPPLARALFHTTKLGQEIPPRLYSAVAQVLTYVYQVKQAAGARGLVLPEIEVDDDLTRRAWQRGPSEANS